MSGATGFSLPVANRGTFNPPYRCLNLGFRVARSESAQKTVAQAEEAEEGAADAVA